MPDRSSVNFLRYPGGKQRQLASFAHLLPTKSEITGNYVEPFVGGGSVFFHLDPQKAILSDINPELVDLYAGVKDHPCEVWRIFSEFPKTKKGYYIIRDMPISDLDLAARAARTLYINRTCFKGMWRHNANGTFNVGYGGQARRWVITKEHLMEISRHLRKAVIRCADFETVINECQVGDYIFLDPPYCPGEKEMRNAHYRFGKFSFGEQERLAHCLRSASERGVRWALTNSVHPDIVALYSEAEVDRLPKGTGMQIGQLTSIPGEVLIRNFEITR